MKKFLLFIIGFIAFSTIGVAQTDIAFQGFEGTSNDNWSITYNDGTISNNSGSSDTPANARIRTGSYSWQVSNNYNTLQLDAIDVSAYTSVKILIHVSATSTSSSVGVGSNDFVMAYVNLNGGGFPSTADVQLNGFNNALWDYSAAFTAKTNAGSPITVSSPQGGLNSNNYAVIEIDVPDGSTSVALKIAAYNSNSAVKWNIDDVELVATVEPPASFTANATSSSEIDLSWAKNSNNDDVIIAYSTGFSFGDPVNGTAYNVGDALTGGGTVIYKGSLLAYQHTGLSAGTAYNYKIWSVNGSNNYSSTGIFRRATTLKAEPTNHVTDFQATADSPNQISLSWTENDGTVVPDGYLIKASTGTITDPVDGTDPTSNDLDLTDGSGHVKVSHGQTSYSFTNCSPNTTYHFKIYPYTNSGSAIDFKTDSPVPEASATTLPQQHLLISEVADPSDNGNARFVELYNAGSSAIDFGTEAWYLSIQVNGGTFTDVQLTGKVGPGETYVTSYSTNNFQSSYGFNSNLNTGFNGDGNDGYFLYKGGGHSTGTLVDAYGVINQDGAGTDWDYTDRHAVRNASVTQPNPTWTSSEWTISSGAVADMTPGTHGNCITWNGKSSSAWSTVGNWVGGSTPTSNKNIILPAGVSNTLAIDGTAASPNECNNLTIASGDALTIPAGKALTVSGNLINNNSDNSGLIIQSDATGNGSLIVDGSVTGDAKVYRYIAKFTGDDNGWHEIGCPVASFAVSGSTWDPTLVGTYNDLYYWDESQHLWMNYRDAGFNLSPNKGYLVANDANLDHFFTGVLNNTNITDGSLTYTTGSFAGSNLLGNPYPCALKWNDGNWTLTNVGGVAHIWNDAAGNYTSLQSNGIIPSTNGFFVTVNSTGGSGSVTIPLASRVHASQSNYKKAAEVQRKSELKFKITDNANGFYDVSYVGFKPNATEGWDMAFDGYKFFSMISTAPEIWTVINHKNFSVNYLPEVSTPYDVPLDFKPGVSSVFHLSISGIDSFDHPNFVLEDKKTGKMIDLTKQTVYDFSANANDDKDRFVLHINGVTAVPSLNRKGSLEIFSYGKTIYLKADKNLNGLVSVYNTMGQKVYEGRLNGMNKQIIPLNDKRGIYIVRVERAGGMMIKKVFIQ